MNTPDYLALIGTRSAFLMVVFPFVILYRGGTTLRQANPEEAIKVGFQQVFNIQTACVPLPASPDVFMEF